MKTIRRIINWLGPTRAQIIFALLALTGLGSLMLNAVRTQVEGQQGQSTWVPLVQSLLVIVFLVGTALTVLSRFAPQERRQFSLAVLPSVAAISLGVLFPSLMAFFLPVSIGWLLIALIMMRGRIRREYQIAIKHMRNGEYDEAVQVMSDLIKEEADNADHYRFRAELFRLSGKIRKARTDYEKVIALTPESGVGYNGLAEVYLQDGEFEQALGFAQKALELEPDHWVAPYNLGMIEDRLGLWAQAAEQLSQALTVGVPDSRHRLLIHLWIARAYYGQGKTADSEAEIDKMKHERTGLQEWQTIFESDEARVLRDVLLPDVELAERLIEGESNINALAKVPDSSNVEPNRAKQETK
jgi:tetratricopeptide (TPR) repeat protein